MAGEVRKAIIPAAGLGTRLGPLTQAIPKEMFPLNRRAVIEYAVEEAIRAGIHEIGVVIRRGKEVICDYLLTVFSRRDVEVSFIIQKQPRGLGDAIMASVEFVGGNPFAVLLPDIVFRVGENPMRDLLDFYARTGKSCFCLVEISAQNLHRYGSLRGTRMGDGVFKITYVSNQFNPDISFGEVELRGCGRTIFTPRVFGFPRVDKDRELNDGEVLDWLAGVDEVWGLRVPYRAYDAGTYEGYMETVNAFWQSVAAGKTKRDEL